MKSSDSSSHGNRPRHATQPISKSTQPGNPDAWPAIDHIPWSGISLADFVMPSFDFIVGVSVTIVFRTEGRVMRSGPDGSGKGKGNALRKATIRFLKLFLLGMLTQGGVTCFQFDLAHWRIMGILQRVAVCYYFAALVEIYGGQHEPSASGIPTSPSQPREMLDGDRGERGDIETDEVPMVEESRAGKWRLLRPHVRIFTRYGWPWFIALTFIGAHSAILYGVHVPNCGYGQIMSPACNAASYVDRLILSAPHMYFPANGGSSLITENDATFQRLPACSRCPPVCTITIQYCPRTVPVL